MVTVDNCCMLLYQMEMRQSNKKRKQAMQEDNYNDEYLSSCGDRVRKIGNEYMNLNRSPQPASSEKVVSVFSSMKLFRISMNYGHTSEGCRSN